MKKVTLCAATTTLAVLLLGTAPLTTAQERSQSPDLSKMTHDQLRMQVQDICPVSGNKLGAHGQPVKVKIGQEELFLCCRGCLNQKVNPKHWATIHANFAKAQARCPVMDKPLPEQPKWAIVQGQIVYLCCPPCAKKLEADPKTYLRKVDELYLASLRDKRPSR